VHHLSHKKKVLVFSDAQDSINHEEGDYNLCLLASSTCPSEIFTLYHFLPGLEAHRAGREMREPAVPEKLVDNKNCPIYTINESIEGSANAAKGFPEGVLSFYKKPEFALTLKNFENFSKGLIDKAINEESQNRMKKEDLRQ